MFKDKKIDWDNLDLTKRSAFELSYIRERSYYRYDPPNYHMIYAMLAFFLIMFSFAFFCLHMHWGIQLDSGEFPKFHKTKFWIMESLAFISGIAIIPYWWKRNKASNREWKEMEGIRESIDKELFKR